MTTDDDMTARWEQRQAWLRQHGRKESDVMKGVMGEYVLEQVELGGGVIRFDPIYLPTQYRSL
jgi:hypothetical protein